MRVVHVDTEKGWRGGQRQVLLLACALRDLGIEQWLVLRPGSPLSIKAREAGLSVVELAHHGEADLLAAVRFRRLVLERGATVIHAHAGHAHALAALAFPRRWNQGLRLVVSRRVDNPLRRGLLSLWKWTRGADRILCVSEAARHQVLRMPGLDPGRVEVAYSAIPIREASPRSERHEIPHLISVGALVPHKGHEVLLRALPLLRTPVHLSIFGDGPLRSSLEALVKTLGLQQRVRFHGFVDDVTQRLGQHDLFVHPSMSEGLGSSILDAMMEGLPVVATDAGGIGELVIPGKTGWVAKAGDVQALAEAIDLALDQPDSPFPGQARELVLQRHSTEALARKTLQQYQLALDDLPAPWPRYPGVFRIGPESNLEDDRLILEGEQALLPGGAPKSGPVGRDELPGWPAQPSVEGRGQLLPVLFDGRPCWRKRHRRGGLLGRWLPGHRRPIGRLVRSLKAMERGRQAGLLIPSTLRIEVRGRSWFQVDSIVEHWDGFLDLEAYLRGPEPQASVLRGLGASLRQMHDAGVDHGDLNIKNVLVGPTGQIAWIDFDPATAGPALSSFKRRRRLARLQRSLVKRMRMDAPWFGLILEGYGIPGLWGSFQQRWADWSTRIHSVLWGRT